MQYDITKMHHKYLNHKQIETSDPLKHHSKTYFIHQILPNKNLNLSTRIITSCAISYL